MREQGLRGKADGQIADVCRREGRAIVTSDLDFADIRKYPPQDYHGIIVLRLNNRSRAAALTVLGRIIPLLEADPPAGCLWIVDEHQVRIRGGNS